MEKKLEVRAQEYIFLLLEQYRKNALRILRDYQAQRAYIEWALDVPMETRQAYRKAIEALRDRQLLELRKDAQATISALRVKVADLGGKVGPLPALHDFGKDEIERAREVVERLRGKYEQ